MKDRFETWSPIIIPTVVSLIFGSVGLYLLSQFKEQLPVWFYNTLIWVIYFVFVAILVLFLVLIIRAAFGDWLRKQIKEFRQRRYRRKLAKTLFAKWCELSELIPEILRKRNRKPTRVQSQKYFKLHFWFIANRPRFLSEWYSFDFYRTDAAHEHEYWDSTSDLGYKVFRTHSRDPFSYFYEPLTAKVLMYHLRDESASEVNFVLSKLTELTLEFVRWVIK